MPLTSENLAAPSIIADRSSMQTVKEAIAARQIHKNSFAGLSIVESEEEEEDYKEKPRDVNRPFSLSNTYPFTSSQNSFGNANPKFQSVSVSPKASSRFSEDEKKGMHTNSENNDFQSSTWNLFGRSSAASPMWRHTDGNSKTPGSATAAYAAVAARRRRRVLLLVVLVLLLIAIAGAAAGIGLWRNHAARADARQDTASADAANAAGNSDVKVAGTAKASATRSSTSDPAATAVPGSGGPGGYYTLVAFGSSYSGIFGV